MPKATPGILVQCDPSINAILDKINREHNLEFILESINDETILVKNGKLEALQMHLKIALRDTVREADDSGSD